MKAASDSNQCGILRRILPVMTIATMLAGPSRLWGQYCGGPPSNSPVSSVSAG
jgi:hypothetical protein